LNEWYKTGVNNSFIISVQPVKDGTDTKFQFDYYTKGVVNEWYEAIYYEHLEGDRNEFKLYFALVVLGILGLCILIIFCYSFKLCIQCCRNKKNIDNNEKETTKVSPFSGPK